MRTIENRVTSSRRRCTGILRRVACAVFPLLLAHALQAGPVTLPYSEPFTAGAGAFTVTAASGSAWTLTNGAYRGSIPTASVNGIATVQPGQLLGDPLTRPGFVMAATFMIVTNGNSGNSIGFGLFGTDASFTGNVSLPYYLVDIKPGQNVCVLRIGINQTTLVPEGTFQTLTLSPTQPFTLEVKGTYEHGVLRMDVTVRQGAAAETVIAVDGEPLSGPYFGLRNRNNGGTLIVDCDDFVLRRISTVSFSAVPMPFARPGVPYSAQVAAASSTAAALTLTAPGLPSWLTFTPGTNGTGTLSGTPAATHLGAHSVTLAASDTESGVATQQFNVSVLAPTGVFISEFVAENDTGLKDEDGTQADWIELFNSDAAPADVSGWWLSDNPLLPKKWALPAGTTLSGYGFLVVFASGKDRTNDLTRLHASFKLGNAESNHVLLAQPDGTVVSAYTNYPAQRADRSYGAYGSYAQRGYLLTPTPGAPNDAVGYAGFVADTHFSVNRGFYTTQQVVVVSCATPGAMLVYTLDGSTPSLTNGTVVSAPDSLTPPQTTLNIATSTVLRASAFAPSLAPSGPDTQTYLFLADIATQSASGTPPPGWPRGPINGQILNYGMDAKVTSTVTLQQMTNALSALPTISLVTDLANLFDQENGIYVNPYGREEGYECPVSVELMNPDGAPGLHLDAGLRIRGGASRVGSNPKHNFHLYFRSEYGASKLKFPLFGDEGVDEFDRVDLRSTQGNSWHSGATTSATYNRDEWNRYTQAAMGQPYTRSRYYHLYINGQYWGLYGTQERADSDYASSYFGGSTTNYDVIKTYVIPHRVEAADGDNVAWAQLHAAATAGFTNDSNYFAVQGLNTNGAPAAGLTPLVDVDNLVDYTLLHYYVGNGDGPVNTSTPVPKNFYVIRPRDGRFGFRFLAHDCEDTMNAVDVTGTTTVGATLDYFNPRWLSQQLAGNPKYRLRFADRAQKHLFNGGALDGPVAVARWQQFRAQISTAILGESARWGDAKSPNLARTVADWNAANNSIETNFIPNRRAALIAQLRTRGLFPSIDAPAFAQHGGIVSAGYTLAITAPAGTTIFYTLDGSDPTNAGTSVYTNAVPLNNVQVTVKARARHNTTAEWSALTQATFTLDAVLAAPGNLAISEINYNPPGSSDDTEFIELLNLSGGRLILSGARLSNAVAFTFTNTVLEAGARICVGENQTAFAALYPQVMFAGQWSGKLDNSGDTIILLAANGAEIERVPYNDHLPWPVEADGDGYSLVRINPLANANDPLNWRASSATNGNPGASDTQPLSAWLSANGYTGPLDTGTSGLPALLTFATALDLTGRSKPDLSIQFQPSTNAPAFLFTFDRRLAADDISVRLDVGSDLASWQTVQPGSTNAPFVTRKLNTNGTERVTVRLPANAPAQFVRLRIQ